ncbi:MAG: hydroxyacid dehydrogenase [Chthoniobacteraceae bacterium]
MQSLATEKKAWSPSPCSNSPRKKAVFVGKPDWIRRIYGKGRFEKVAALTDLYPEVIHMDLFDQYLPDLQEVEVIFSTWGMKALSADQIVQMRSLKAVFYAGGSVHHFARPFLEQGILVISAWQANAAPVAEFTLAQILLAAKGYFRNSREFTAPEKFKTAFRGKGNFGEIVAILGAGAIGQKVIQLLHSFDLEIVVFDPFLTEENAAKLGVKKASLEEAFKSAYVVSNHLANRPETVGMLHGGLFEKMRPDATFINTGRGATINEQQMIRVLTQRPDINALLDVTYPEPPADDSRLYLLPNVHLSSHIAGSIGDEYVRNADYAIQEFLAWRSGNKLQYAISIPMLETMA